MFLLVMFSANRVKGFLFKTAHMSQVSRTNVSVVKEMYWGKGLCTVPLSFKGKNTDL